MKLQRIDVLSVDFQQTGPLAAISQRRRLLDYLKPDVVHMMVDGRIVYSGGFELVHVLEEHGYGWAEEQIRKGETVSPPEAVAG